MPTAIASHFEALRRRFPAESGLWITQTQQSFEMMEWLADDVPRPRQSRCAALDIGNVNFLVWEMDGEMDRFQVFVTTYNVPLGILRLSSKPSGIVLVAGFPIDLAALAAAIAAHFRLAHPPENGDASGKKRKILLFGFAESFGHHFWNEVSGLASAMQSGVFDRIDGVIVGPYDYFNLGPALQAKGKQVWKLNAISSLLTPDRLVMYRSNVVIEEARRLALDNAAAGTSAAERAYGPRSICFQIRGHRRPWVDEENGLAAVIAACAQEWPGTSFIIDGHGVSKGIIDVKQKEIAAEKAFVERLRARFGGEVDLRSTVGMDINDKINRLKDVTLFAGPIGSGGVLSSWLLRKPTIAYGPTAYYDMLKHQENTVPEGGPLCFPVPVERIADIDDDAKSYHVDPADILRQIRLVMQRQAA